MIRNSQFQKRKNLYKILLTHGRFHLGDNDDEVVFWGPNAKNFIKIQLEEINPIDSIYNSITNNIEKFKKARKFNKMSDDEKSDYEMNAVGKSFDYEGELPIS